MTYTIYSKPGCPYCDKIKRVMELAEVKHVVYTLGTDFQRPEFYDKFGQGSTFPQVYAGETHIGGCTDSIAYLREQKVI